MNTADNLTSLIKLIGQPIREQGFSLKGKGFYLQVDGNWGVINFQKSNKSTKDLTVFTVNLGIASQRLFEFFGTSRVSYPPAIEDCHWQERLGFLLPERFDKWWTISNESDVDSCSKEMQNYLLNLVIPTIRKHINDGSLRDLWLSGKSPGLGRLQRLKNLSVLLKALGPYDAYEQILEELRNFAMTLPNPSVVKLHIEKLERLEIK